MIKEDEVVETDDNDLAQLSVIQLEATRLTTNQVTAGLDL